MKKIIIIVLLFNLFGCFKPKEIINTGIDNNKTVQAINISAEGASHEVYFAIDQMGITEDYVRKVIKENSDILRLDFSYKLRDMTVNGVKKQSDKVGIILLYEGIPQSFYVDGDYVEDIYLFDVNANEMYEFSASLDVAYANKEYNELSYVLLNNLDIQIV